MPSESVEAVASKATSSLVSVQPKAAVGSCSPATVGDVSVVVVGRALVVGDRQRHLYVPAAA